MVNSYSRLFFIAIVLPAIGCLCACKKQLKIAADPLAFMEYTTNYKIYPFDSTMKWVFDKPVTAAALSKEEMVEVEKMLKQATDEYNNSADTAHAYIRLYPLQEYWRQIVAVRNEKGEKEVWVNCLCREFNDQWRDRIMSVDDGGRCYFNIKLNLTTKTSSNLMVNGEA